MQNSDTTTKTETTRVALNFKNQTYGQWQYLKEHLEMGSTELASFLVRAEYERRHGVIGVAKIKRGPGRPADSALAKSAKQKVGWQIGVLQRMKDEGTKLPNFDRAVVAMSALMEAGLWQRALDYQRSNWWRQFAPPDQAIEPEWEKWLEEAESE